MTTNYLQLWPFLVTRFIHLALIFILNFYDNTVMNSRWGRWHLLFAISTWKKILKNSFSSYFFVFLFIIWVAFCLSTPAHRMWELVTFCILARTVRSFLSQGCHVLEPSYSRDHFSNSDPATELCILKTTKITLASFSKRVKQTRNWCLFKPLFLIYHPWRHKLCNLFGGLIQELRPFCNMD